MVCGIRLFHLFFQMRYTKKVSVWPVGLVAWAKAEFPILKDNTVVGWKTNSAPNRPFAMDMAGFAVNTELLFKNERMRFSLLVPAGHLETRFLELANITLKDLEPKAEKCTKVGICDL